MLSQALGVDGTVKKTRHLFLVDQTRIHIDQVDGLGDFMELEVCSAQLYNYYRIINFLFDTVGCLKSGAIHCGRARGCNVSDEIFRY